MSITYKPNLIQRLADERKLKLPFQTVDHPKPIGFEHESYGVGLHDKRKLQQECAETETESRRDGLQSKSTGVSESASRELAEEMPTGYAKSAAQVLAEGIVSRAHEISGGMLSAIVTAEGNVKIRNPTNLTWLLTLDRMDVTCSPGVVIVIDTLHLLRKSLRYK